MIEVPKFNFRLFLSTGGKFKIVRYILESKMIPWKETSRLGVNGPPQAELQIQLQGVGLHMRASFFQSS